MSTNQLRAQCPRCKGDMYEGKKNFYCINKNCNFALYKEDKFWTSKKKTLTRLRVESLLNAKEVKVDNLYSAKRKKYYSAYISFIDDGSNFVKWHLDFLTSSADKNNSIKKIENKSNESNIFYASDKNKLKLKAILEISDLQKQLSKDLINNNQNKSILNKIADIKIILERLVVIYTTEKNIEGVKN